MIKRLAYRLLGLLPDRLLRIFPPDKLTKFLIIGAVGAVFGMVLLYALTDKVGLHYLMSLGIGYIPVSYLVYMGNCGWTFRSFLGIRGFGKFLASRAVTTVGGFGLVALLTSVFGVWYMASPVIGAGTMALINFLISRHWIWKEPKVQENCEKSDIFSEKGGKGY